MLEIAPIILSSLAGVATAAAVRKVPRNKNQLLSLGASSHIKSQISSLSIERDILTKTISRLYQDDTEFAKIQKDKLLVKYQHQLGIVLARLEKLDQASKHPDLGPVGDGLITLMDQKLSKLDDRLYELSSKIVSTKVVEESKQPQTKQQEKSKAKQDDPFKSTFNFGKPKQPKEEEPVIVPPTKSRQSFELATLTNVSGTEPRFPSIEREESRKAPKAMPQPRVYQPEVTTVKEEEIGAGLPQPKPRVEDKIDLVKQVTPRPQPIMETKPDIAKEVARITENKALPEPKQEEKPKATTLDDNDDFDEDGDDLDKIKGDIIKVLSKLDQAEVE